MVKRKIVWDSPAKEFLKKSLQYIKQDSPQNADKIKHEIRIIIKDIPAHPERYPADKYRLNNTAHTVLWKSTTTVSLILSVTMK